MRFALMLACSWLLLPGFASAQSPDWVIRTVAGDGNTEPIDQPKAGREFPVSNPFGVEQGPDDAIYITEVGNHRILRLDIRSGQVTRIAGTGQAGYAGDGGPAAKATMNEPYEIRFDSTGNLYVVEMQNHVVRRIDAKTGKIRTIAGTGERGFSGDGGPATQAALNRPHSIALDEPRNRLFIADIGNHRIRCVDLKQGKIETVAGNGNRGMPVDGDMAAGKAMSGPRALFIRDDTMWIALREGHSIWTYDLKSGRLGHVAGTGKKGFSGDGGDARRATFNGPKGIAVDSHQNVVVVDTENQAIRRITPAGKINTIAGRGPEAAGFATDTGDATTAMLNRPHGVCVDRANRIYIGDTLNHRVRLIQPPLRAGIIGLDTSHVIAFTKILNAANPAPALSDCRVVAAYPIGSADIESSVSRRDNYTKQLREQFGVKIVETIPELIQQVDVVFLESNDGRPHLEQAIPVLRANKPTFIDKPIAGSLVDAAALFQVAEEFKTPMFSSSSLRFGQLTQQARRGSVGRVWACDTFGPAPVEPTHPDLFWYGIHGVEALFTVMGPGCQFVRRTATPNSDIVVGQWEGGRSGTFRGLRPPIKRGYGGTAFGEQGTQQVGVHDGYPPMLVEIIRFFRNHQPPVRARETLEIYAFMEAADVSKQQQGARIDLNQLIEQAQHTAQQKLKRLRVADAQN